MRGGDGARASGGDARARVLDVALAVQELAAAWPHCGQLRLVIPLGSAVPSGVAQLVSPS